MCWGTVVDAFCNLQADGFQSCTLFICSSKRLHHHWVELSIAHVIIIIKSEVSNFPIVIIVSLVVCLRCLLHNIRAIFANTLMENRELNCVIIAHFMMSANSRIRFGLQIVFICLHITPSHYHHFANFSEDIVLIKWLSYKFSRVSE